ncbi:MAG: PDZ domain-containing protein [Acidobacteria bacterium]|nr:PDZ domain-containing protein [Acidobacteriota bacterium]
MDLGKHRVWFLSLSAAGVLFVLGGVLLGNVLAREENTYAYLRLFHDAVQLIENNYVEEVEADHLLRGAYQGLLEALDPESEYLPAPEYQELLLGGPLPPADPGIGLHRVRGHLLVLSVRPGGPADRAGIQRGDQIQRIDVISTQAMSLSGAESRLRGERGADVTLTLAPSGGGTTREMRLTREASPPPVELEFLGEGTGRLRLRGLPADAAARVEESLVDFQRRDGRGLILDLRDTSARSLRPALDTARLFLDAGPLALVQERDGARSPIEEQTRTPAWRGPIVVLVNGATASGAELLAAALQGSGRSALLGQNTFGSGTRTELFPLPNGAAVRLSTGRLLAPDGKAWHGTGLTPDLVLDPKLEEAEVLARAREWLQSARRPEAAEREAA